MLAWLISFLIAGPQIVGAGPAVKHHEAHHPGTDCYVQVFGQPDGPKPCGQISRTKRRLTGSGTDPARHVCNPRRLHLRIPQPQGATGFMMAGLFMKLTHGPPCKVDGTLRFAVRRTTGRLARPIAHNPSVASLHARLRPERGRLISGWRWGNWCHKRHHFKFTASYASARASRRTPPPPCEGPGAPSSLQRWPVGP